MHEPKPLSAEAIPAALAKAERYRLLNESDLAESICQDILATDGDNQLALVTLILAITDQFRGHAVGSHLTRARALLPRLRDEYERLYYGGIVHERCARAYLAHGRPAGDTLAVQSFTRALALFEQAMAIRTAGNDDAVLRWNACARTLNAHPELAPRLEEPAATIQAEW